MKKIFFCDKFGLTNAVLQGTKTMTRRLVGSQMTEYDIKAYLKGYTEMANKCAPYKIGDVVAVAEPYKNIFEPDVMLRGSKVINGKRKKGWYPAIELGGWNNSMFICPEYMRHFIRITDLKVERLQDISEEDCLKEGIQEYFPYIDRDPNDKVRTFRYFKDGKIRHCISPASKCFAHLIDDISGKGTWDSNPYVFAYTFELV